MKMHKRPAKIYGTAQPRPSREVDVPVGPRLLMVVLGLLYTCAVLWVTLRPIAWAADGAEETRGILDPEAWTDLSAWTEGRPLEVVLNVLMFLPVGVTAGLLHRGIAGMVGPVILTLVIELAQIPLDRISHPRDLVANAVGALAGIAVMAAHRHTRDVKGMHHSRFRDVADVLSISGSAGRG